MTPATPPVLYISADTSDLTTRYKATPRMHMGADAWVPKETLDTLRDALVQIDALDPERLIDSCSQSAMRGLVLRMGEIARAALAALPAPDEGEQDEGE